MPESPLVLGCDDPPPVRIERQYGSSPFVILCDHASNRLPRALGTLGLPASDLLRHIAWDIGARAVASQLGVRLDAPVVLQQYSRLVIDCNRAPEHPDSIPDRSELTDIPGNAGLDAIEQLGRKIVIFDPYHHAIKSLLDERFARGRRTIVVAQHSFTPIFHGAARPWEVGILYDRDPRLGRSLGTLLRAEGIAVGDNEPYRLCGEIDYTISTHAETRSLPYVEIEIRQDLIAEPLGQDEWAERLARLLPAAARTLS